MRQAYRSISCLPGVRHQSVRVSRRQETSQSPRLFDIRPSTSRRKTATWTSFAGRTNRRPIEGRPGVDRRRVPPLVGGARPSRRSRGRSPLVLRARPQTLARSLRNNTCTIMYVQSFCTDICIRNTCSIDDASKSLTVSYLTDLLAVLTYMH